ncbi:MAG: DNA-3-methyladenine glycosylase 2 family protein [Methanomicrobiales archaeon]|jgi:DNA-3-methyladenine glycosylase II|nr:DNA-3-methyladenine glycosylase 2 family protein [Methanomicrobiales archaeon]
MQYFVYGEREISHLMAQDAVLGEAIAVLGYISREVEPDLFTALLRSIISQQISTKAAATVWGRFSARCGVITPDAVLSLSFEEIVQCGMSGRKVHYVFGLAHAICSNTLDLSRLSLLHDDDIIRTLCKLPGIGPWTAEMMLIFSLCRPDVVSFSDLGIRKGMMKLYQLDVLSKEQFMEYRMRYFPYGSVASLYLWEIVHKNGLM